MATIASLAVSLTANTGKFVEGMKKAEKSSGSLSKASAVAKKSIAAVGIAAAAAAGGMALLVKRQFEVIDQTAKMADRLGLNTKSLGTFELAARRSGVESNTLFKSMQKLAEGVSDAAMGTGEAKVALEQLGLSAQKLKARSPEQQFLDVSRALSRVTNQTDKVRIAVDLFGARGAGLINTSRELSENFGELTVRANALGLNMDRIDAAKVERANDAMGEARSIFSGLARQAAFALAPSIEHVSKLILKMVENAGGVEAIWVQIKAAALDFGSATAEVVAFAIESWDRFGAAADLALATIRIALNPIIHAVDLMKAGLNQAILVLAQVGLSAADAAHKLASLLPGDTRDSVLVGIEKIQSALGGVKESAERNVEKGAAEVIGDLEKDTLAAAEATERLFREGYGDGAQKALSIATDLSSKAVDTRREIEALKEAMVEQGGLSSTIIGVSEDPETVSLRDNIKMRFDLLKNEASARLEITKQFLKNRQAALAEFNDLEVVTEEERTAKRLEALRAAHESSFLTDVEFQEKKTELLRQSEEVRADMERQAQLARAASFQETGNAILGAIGAFSNKSIKLQKAVSLTESGIAIATGIARAQALPFPANLAEAARIATVGANVINTIKSANVGSGGSVSPSGAATSQGPSASVNRVVNRNFDIAISGETVSNSSVRNLISRIDEELSDGANGGSINLRAR